MKSYLKLNDKYIISIIIQSFAPLSIFITSYLIYHYENAQALGEFATVRSAIDLLTALVQFGLPQSVLFAINRENSSRIKIIKFSFVYSIIMPSILSSIFSQFSIFNNIFGTYWYVIPVSIYVFNGILRAVTLTLNDRLSFYITTALPTTFTALIASVFLYSGFSVELNIGLLFVASSVLAFLTCLIIIKFRFQNFLDNKNSPSLYNIVTMGFDAFLVSTFSSLQIFLSFYLIRSFGSIIEVAYFSIALQVLNLFNFPQQSIAPLLLNSWTNMTSKFIFSKINRFEKTIYLIYFLISIFTIFALQIFSFLASYKILSLPWEVWFILLSASPSLYIKIASLRFASIGNYKVNSKLSLLRIIVFISVFYFVNLFNIINALNAVVLGWVVSDIIMFLYYYLIHTKFIRDVL